jgi:hypothetical protein
MAGTGTQGAGVNGVVRLSWVTDQLAHVLQSQADEGGGIWTGLSCPDHGLEIGSDVHDETLLRLSGHGEIADLVWEAPPEFTADYSQRCTAAIQAHMSGRLGQGDHLLQQAMALWSQAWSANYQVLELMQEAGLSRFSEDKPQRWVIASFEHNTGPHGLPRPHIHNIVIPALTTRGR